MTVTVTKISPLGQQIERFTPLVFQVTATGALTYVNIFNAVGGQQHLLYKYGVGFSNGYMNYSTVTELVAEQSYEYSILPDQGWLSNPQIEIDAGELPSTQLAFSNTHSASFQAEGKFIRFPDHFNFEYTDSWSFAFFYKGLYNQEFARWFGNFLGSTDKGWGVSINPSGGSAHKFFFSISDGSNNMTVKTVTDALNSAWKHLACTYDGSNSATGMKIYLNGTDETTISVNNPMTATIVDAAQHLTISKEDYTSWGINNGLFSNLLVWPNKVLNQSEITDIYNAGSPHDLAQLDFWQPSVASWWLLGSSDDDFPVVFDRGDNREHGGVCGAVFSTDVP